LKEKGFSEMCESALVTIGLFIFYYAILHFLHLLIIGGLLNGSINCRHFKRSN